MQRRERQITLCLSSHEGISDIIVLCTQEMGWVGVETIGTGKKTVAQTCNGALDKAPGTGKLYEYFKIVVLSSHFLAS